MGAESADGDHQTPRSVLENDDEDLHSDASMNSEVHVDPEADNSEVENYPDNVGPSWGNRDYSEKHESMWVHHMKKHECDFCSRDDFHFCSRSDSH